MTLPKTLTIDGRKWKVIRGDPGEGDVGSCEFKTRTITLAPFLKGRDLEETFWHEVTHAMIPEAQIFISQKQEELLVELLGQRLPAVVKQVKR
jgi:hypothetical protein